ncbi:MAG: hypothetical protein PHW04_11070 [Candidatus Wallbacteria bacterium]|nr:hypothetical protein [Candidatus Wallbacteria bacterium]
MRFLALALMLSLLMFSLPLLAEDTASADQYQMTDTQKDQVHQLRSDFTAIKKNSQPSEAQIATIKDDMIALYGEKNDAIDGLCEKLATALAQSRANGRLTNHQKNRTADHIFVVLNSKKYSAEQVQNSLQGVEGDVTASGNSPEQASAVVSSLRDIVDFNSRPVVDNSKIQELKDQLLKENTEGQASELTNPPAENQAELVPAETEKAVVKKPVKKTKKPVKKATKKPVKKVTKKPVPVTETPAVTETAPATTPAAETPVTPAAETPAAPATETPATPAAETPATPAAETPATPATETPATGH